MIKEIRKTLSARHCIRIRDTLALAAVMSLILPVPGGSPVQASDDSENVRHFSIEDPEKWYQHTDRRIFLADVLDASNGETMTVGFARYDKGATNEWIVTYDEALVVTRGAFTVRYDGGSKTATAGEVIFLNKGTKVAYVGEQDNTEVVYITYPHWFEAQSNSEHAHMLDSFHPE